MNNVKNLLCAGDDTSFYVTVGIIIAIFVLMIVMQSRRRQKSQAEYLGMLDTLRVGTRVKTVGGVIGKIVEIREEAPGFKTVLIETGDAKNPSRVLYDMQAIYGVVDTDAILANAIKVDTDRTTMLGQNPPRDQKDDVQNRESTDKRVDATENSFEAQKPKKKSGK